MLPTYTVENRESQLVDADGESQWRNVLSIQHLLPVLREISVKFFIFQQDKTPELQAFWNRGTFILRDKLYVKIVNNIDYVV